MKATLLQRKALKLTMENNGNVSKAMKDAGYAPSTSKNPHLLKETEGWKELMKEMGLDDRSLLKKTKDLMEAGNIDRFTFDGDIPDDVIKDIFAEVAGIKVLYIRVFKGSGKRRHMIESKTAYILKPDTVAQDKALDKAFRMIGAYAKDGEGTVVAVQVNNLLGNKKEEYGI